MDSVGAMPMSVAKVVYSHAGLCPNELNPNLWVDAMSTCTRECESDQVGSRPSIYRTPFCPPKQEVTKL